MTSQYQKRQWAVERLLRRLWLMRCDDCADARPHPIHGDTAQEIQAHADWTREAAIEEEMKKR